MARLATANPIEAFEPLFAQRALLAVLALAVLAAALGPTIVLRELPFYAHAVGGGAYPVLVAGLAIGTPLALMAPLGALLFGGVLWAVSVAGDRASTNRDAEIALALAGAFAAGAVLSATAFDGQAGASASPESLLFGSVLTAGGGTIAAAWATALVCAVATWALAPRWLAFGFDALGPRPATWRVNEAALLALVALAVATTLPLAGALMGAALLVIPAATARVLTGRRERLTLLTLTIATTEGVTGMYLALVFDLPPGALIAALAGVMFALAALVRTLASAPRARLVLTAIGAVLLLALNGCGDDEPAGEQAKRPSVVATTTQLGDVARAVAGDDAEVTTLLRPDTDPHEYEPTPSDVQALADADVVLYSGGDLDAWLADALASSGSNKTPVDVSQSVTLIESAGDEHGDEDDEHADEADDEDHGGGFNSHWYLTPANLMAAADRVRIELAKARFAARDTFRANANSYRNQAEEAAAKIEACAQTVPSDRRAVVTEHNDFAYLTDLLGVEVVAQLRETGAGEASARDADEALRKARDAGAGAVLVSQGEGGALPATAARRLGVPLLQLRADALADSGEAATALGAITSASREIVDALGGDAARCPGVAG
jgi:ABC-type Zn uptake system ZnuABC Zn-binding protein ZnuA/ABC-type Mn2+/Zn2+ transport system permease subunit